MSTFEDVQEHLGAERNALRDTLKHLLPYSESLEVLSLTKTTKDTAIAAQRAFHPDCRVCQAFDGKHRPPPKPDDA